jgi:multidrug efflux pump subunit AcrA (membrane-fusion protein)
VTKPVEPPKAVEAPKPAEGGGGGKWVLILLILLAIGGAVFWFVIRPTMMPQKVSVKTTTAVVADVTRNFTTPAMVKASAPVVLKIGGAGKVSMVVEPGKSVTAGSSLVELDSLVTTQKAQADAQKALDALKKKLETGRLKGKAAADLQAKITEKQNKIGELEAQSKNAKLLADKDVQVDKVLVTKGQAVTAGTDAVSILEKGLIAELKVASTDSASLSEGQKVSLTNASKSVSLKGSIKSIAKQDDGSLVTLGLPDDASVKAGDELLVEKAVLKQVTALPALALVDGSRVLVVKEGKAAAVSVTVSEQDADSVLVSGLSGGEQVISTRSPELHEGTLVEVGSAH